MVLSWSENRDRFQSNVSGSSNPLHNGIKGTKQDFTDPHKEASYLLWSERQIQSSIPGFRRHQCLAEQHLRRKDACQHRTTTLSIHSFLPSPFPSGMFGLVSDLDLHLTCPLPYQRNRTPMEYGAVCSAQFNLAQHGSPRLSAPLCVCAAGPAAFSYSAATARPWTCNRNLRSSALEKPKDKTVYDTKDAVQADPHKLVV